VIFAVEPLEKVWGEIYEAPHGLAYQHWNETQGHRHGQGYAPSKERYQQYEKAGWFIQFVVRDGGRAVGYAGCYVLPSMHTQQIISTEDTWYLLPEYRRGWNAIRFYRYMEGVCRDRGAVEATLTLPQGKNLDVILRRLGYNCISRQFSKNLVRADSAQPEKSEDVCAVSTATA
jgi:hypothetical protein